MSDIVVPVICGLAVGSALIVVMIFVGSSFDRSDTQFYGDGGANVIAFDPDHEPFFSSSPGELVIVDEGDNVDGCCDDVATIEFSQELNTPLHDND